MMNKYINLTLDNIDNEHICCAISDKKHQNGVNFKKQWLKERIKEGHVFRKLDVKGKVFIEYAPVETAWTPIGGDDFMYIYCLWVSGSFKGKGYGKELLEYAIKDSQNKGKKGICVVVAKKKKPFMADKKFFEYFGFQMVDEIGDYQLLALSFVQEKPYFYQNAKQMQIEQKELTIFYSFQCPFCINGIKEIKKYSQENHIKVNIIKVDTLKKAKEMPCLFNSWVNFKDGKFLSNTLLNKNSFIKLLK